MTTYYVDSSAWLKLLIEEDESAALAAFVDDRAGTADAFVSSQLLVTEVWRAVHRLTASGSPAPAPTDVSDVLAHVHLFLPERSVYRDAALLFAGLAVRSLDALHVAHCKHLEADVFITYDDRQGEAAQSIGIPTLAPR